MKKIIRLKESELRRMISESVRRMVNEINYLDMPLGDFNERNKWFKAQADADFPEHGIKDSPNWQDTYDSLVKKKKEMDKKQKITDKQNAKKQAIQQKMDKMREKYNLYSKALDWAVNGTDEGFEDYDEMLNFFPIVIKLGLGKEKKVKAKIDSVINNGYSGVMKFNGKKYYITLNNCNIWMDDNCKVQVKLDNIKVKNDGINMHNFDIISTIEAMKAAFNRKVKQNVKYMMETNSSEGALNEGGHLYHKDEDGNVWTNSKETYRGVPGSTYIWHGEWSDPEILWDGVELNANDVEESLWYSYEEECKDNGENPTEEGYEDWLKEMGTDYIASQLDDLSWAAQGCP
jgi:hypothetical protein